MAAQVVSGTVTINASIAQTDTAGLINQIQASGTISALYQLANATGAANSIDTLYSAQLTLSAAATHINLHAATDILGNSVVFARVRFWCVQVVTTTAAFIVNIYTRTASNPLAWLPQVTTATLFAPPGGMVMGVDSGSTSTNGYVVSSGANDFTVDPGANTVVCNVTIAGNSAA